MGIRKLLAAVVLTFGLCGTALAQQTSTTNTISAPDNANRVVCVNPTTHVTESCAGSGGGGGGGAAQADNTTLADITGAGALYATAPPAVTNGNVGIFRMSTDRYLFTIFPSAQPTSAAQSGAWSVGQTGVWTQRLFDGSGNSISSHSNALDTYITNALAVSWASAQHVIVDSAPSTAVTGPLTDAQLRATAVPVSGTFWQATQPVSLGDASSTGTIVANNGVVAVTPAGNATARVQLTTSDASGQANFEATADGTNWQSVYATPPTTGVNGALTPIKQTTFFGLADSQVYSISATGWQQLRVRVSPYTSGTLTVAWRVGAGAVPEDPHAAILVDKVGVPVGQFSNKFYVDGSGAVQPVSGTFWQSTQPVSIASLPSLAAGTAVIGHVIVDTAPTTAVTGPLTDAQLRASAVPVSAASLPLPTGAAQDSSLTTLDTDVKANVTLHAGTNIVGKVGIDQTTPGTTNGVQVNAALPAGSNVIGHVIADSGSTTAITGNVATTVADAANVTFGAKADAKSTATDTTAVTAMQVLKEISAMEQAPASRAVTNAGTFAVQASVDQSNNGVTNKVYADTGLINGVATAVGNGTSGSNGTQRVTIASDSTGQTKITDGTDTAQVTTTSGGSLQVECAAGCGSPATTNLVTISLSESIAAPTAATWVIRRDWTPAAGAHFIPTRAWAAVTTAGSRTIIGVAQKLGSFNTGTNVFTDANSVALPRFYSRIFACVATALSATADTLTISYFNPDPAGVFATVALPASAPVANCFDMLMGSSNIWGNIPRDNGAYDVSNVTDSAATTGVVEIWGVNPILDTLGVANAYETNTYDAGELATNEHIWILIQQAAVTAQQRSAGVMGSIR